MVAIKIACMISSIEAEKGILSYQSVTGPGGHDCIICDPYLPKMHHVTVIFTFFGGRNILNEKCKDLF